MGDPLLHIQFQRVHALWMGITEDGVQAEAAVLQRMHLFLSSIKYLSCAMIIGH